MEDYLNVNEKLKYEVIKQVNEKLKYEVIKQVVEGKKSK